MIHRTLVASLALFGLVALGCHHPPEPVYPAHAPASVARLRIHVHNAERARAEREENVNLYTIFLRQSVERALTRAGYAVVVNPSLPYDLAANVDLQDFTITLRKPEEATATLMLRAGERVVDNFSAVVVLDENADIDEHGPVALVDAITRSGRVATFAAALPEGGTPAAPRPVPAPVLVAPEPEGRVAP